ncbi:hypothetical protein [Clostridium sp.]|uniref:hypothetical protein n=1 Tax=Clostridium sp. TaxID=1506 RepID=UPI002A910D53|nr:hypothetical protein [Clostridium sp.]
MCNKDSFVIIRNRITFGLCDKYRKLLDKLNFLNKHKNLEIKNRNTSIGEKLIQYLSIRANDKETMRLATFIRLGSRDTCVTFVVQALRSIGEDIPNNIIEIDMLISELLKRNFTKVGGVDLLISGDIVIEPKHVYIFKEWTKEKNIARVYDNQHLRDKKIKGVRKEKFIYWLKIVSEISTIIIIILFITYKILGHFIINYWFNSLSLEAILILAYILLKKDVKLREKYIEGDVKIYRK